MIVIGGAIPSASNRYRFSTIKTVESISTDVMVNWTWYNESEGIVSWNFKNNSLFQETVVLFRNGYYFAGAYYPIYLEAGITSWAEALKPLPDRGVRNNTMPLGIVDFGNGKRIVAFLFSFAPGQTWSCLEGGFTKISQPSNGAVYGVKLEKTGQFCVGFDPQQVRDYDAQTSSSFSGFVPNPLTVNTVEVAVSPYANYVQLFPKDSIKDSACSAQEVIIEERREAPPDDLEEIVGTIIKRIRSF